MENDGELYENSVNIKVNITVTNIKNLFLRVLHFACIAMWILDILIRCCVKNKYCF